MSVKDGINRKHKTSVQKRNIRLRQNRNNIVAKQKAAPKFTTKPIGKKKLRLMNKGKGMNDHSRFHRKKEEHTMAVEDTEEAAPAAPKVQKRAKVVRMEM